MNLADLIFVAAAWIGSAVLFLIGLRFGDRSNERDLDDELCLKLASLSDNEYQAFSERWVESSRPALDEQRVRGLSMIAAGIDRLGSLDGAP